MMIQRREFIRNAVGSALALAAAGMSADALGDANQSIPIAGNSAEPGNPLILRGVNLGSWLVLEKWMVPDVYQGSDAPDEYSLSLALGDQARPRLQKHR